MKDVIQNKLRDYDCRTAEEEESAIKEITQEVILYALAKVGFFSKAVFQGGTCLRIIHGLDRFSEDLDFILNATDVSFDISPYLEAVGPILRVYGYEIEITGEDKADQHIRKRFLRDDAIKKVLNFKHYSDIGKKIKIKIELDVNPPPGSKTEQEYIDFPIDFSLAVQDLSSLFAGKCHALLCRKFIKGRDWYDFSWYVSKNITPNYEFLTSALKQVGPWQHQEFAADSSWLREKLSEKIETIDWGEAVEDIKRFLKPEGRESLNLWETRFFLKKAEKIK